MTTVRPQRGTTASSGDDEPNRRLPIRWLVIGLIAAIAGVAAYSAGGQAAAILTATGVAAALHKMID